MPTQVWQLFLCMSLATFSLSAEIHRDVEYSRVGDTSLRLDYSIPEGPGPFPAVIVVHGGAWIRGDKAVDAEPVFAPLEAAHIAWFSINYRLATDILQFGVAIEDVKASILFVKQNAGQFRVDPRRIALVGESAGGQLAAMAALSEDPALSVAGVVALYTPSDLVALATSSEMVPAQIRNGLKGSPFEGMIMARLKQLSPINSVHRGMPPFLFIHGTSDSLVPYEQSTAMCNRMKAVDAACRVYPVEGGDHGIRWWESIPAIRGPWKVEMITWLQDLFGLKA
ncbi:MAG: alpha/beta hydrolase [Terriglobia bacterium]